MELDRLKPEIKAKWDAAEDDKGVAEAVRFEKSCEDDVRRAFFEDTKDRNCLQNCLLVGISTLREWVGKAEKAREQ